MIEWMEDQDNVKRSIGAEPVEDVREKSEQVHVALPALTESESLDIVLGAATSGLQVLGR